MEVNVEYYSRILKIQEKLCAIIYSIIKKIYKKPCPKTFFMHYKYAKKLKENYLVRLWLIDEQMLNI
jgi:mRNA-degrading endonuclease RelE of RelBE toxin-antitoxin system